MLVLIYIINSSVASILAVVKPVPSPVKSIIKKQIKPPRGAAKLERALYKLLPKASLM
jgi:hypothetical protein